MSSLLPVVEGDGDVQAVPELIRRIAHEAGVFDLKVLRPHRRGDLPAIQKRFDDFLQVALLEKAPVLWVLDYDCATCDDPLRDLRRLQQRADDRHPSQPVRFALMVREFEALFLADRETTASFFSDIPAQMEWPADPESVRDAKGWLSAARPRGAAYKETTHQVKLAAQLDLDRLRARSPSFTRFETVLLELLHT